MSKASEEWGPLRRGWCWGPKSFRENLLEQIGAKKGTHHHGEELRESDEPKAQRLVAELLREAGWQESELSRRLKGDAKKGRMAARLRAETAMTWRWIAERLAMGHWRTAANAARRAGLARRK